MGSMDNGGVGLFIILMIYLFTWIEAAGSMVGSALVTGGALLILTGVAAMWATGHMTLLANAVDQLVAYDISKTTAINFFRLTQWDHQPHEYNWYPVHSNWRDCHLFCPHRWGTIFSTGQMNTQG